MEQRFCPFCQQQFALSRFHPEQTVCPAETCQRQRRHQNRKRKLALDPEYRQVCSDSARKWRADHPGYWKGYRGARPGSVERNRTQQRQRDLRRRLSHLANNNSALDLKSSAAGVWLLGPAAQDLANNNLASTQVFILQAQRASSPSERYLANNISLVCRRFWVETPDMQDVERLKQRIPLLDYLRQQHWTARAAGQQEFVGLCPLHQDNRPSFYVNARKNLFYCHGCGRGGDLIRFVELSQHLSFCESLAFLQRQLAAPQVTGVLEQAAAFYRLQLHRHPEAGQYLERRGLRDAALIEELGIGYAPGGSLRRHLAAQGYPLDQLLDTGLINHHGRDAFCRRVIFPCRQEGQIVNLYGRSIGAAFPHRLLPRSKGGLFGWEPVRQSSTVILVEGLFDLAVLWQASFRNTTCAIGTCLTPAQFAQLCDPPGRLVYIVFDQDENHAGQQAAHQLAQRLENVEVMARIVQLPAGHDPNSYFLAGATAADFARYLQQAHLL